MIEFLKPDAAVGVEQTPYNLSVSVDGSAQTTIGLFANGFPDSVEFLNQVGEAVARRRPGINPVSYTHLTLPTILLV